MELVAGLAVGELVESEGYSALMESSLSDSVECPLFECVACVVAGGKVI